MRILLTCAAVLAAVHGAAGAQSASYGAAMPPTPYGLVDLTLRYTSNESPDGKSRVALADGAQTGSRIGIRGVEAFGLGLKAAYVLESGFNADTGTLQQGGRLFGRQAYVALSNGRSTVAVGRMYTGTYDMLSSFDAFGLANNELVAPQTQQYTGHRYDNMLKFVGREGDVEITADVSAARSGGEPPGPFNQAGGYDGAAVWTRGPWRLGVAYGGQHGVTSYFGAPIPAQTQKVWAAGLSYKEPRSDVRLYAGYIDTWLQTSDIRNRTYQMSFDWRLARNTQMLASWTRDEMHNYGGADGTRDGVAVMFDYYFSARTDVYVEADYSKLQGAWMTVASLPSYANYDPTNGPFFAGYPTRSQFMIGLRHRFSR